MMSRYASTIGDSDFDDVINSVVSATNRKQYLMGDSLIVVQEPPIKTLLGKVRIINDENTA